MTLADFKIVGIVSRRDFHNARSELWIHDGICDNGNLTAHEREHQREIDDLRRKSLVSLVAGLAMMAIMVLPLHLNMMLVDPLLLIAATIVSGLPSGRAGVSNDADLGSTSGE